MGKKRLVIDLNDADHAELVKKARGAGMTVANYVRQATGLPLERQGVKRPEVKAAAATGKAKDKPAPKGK